MEGKPLLYTTRTTRTVAYKQVPMDNFDPVIFKGREQEKRKREVIGILNPLKPAQYYLQEQEILVQSKVYFGVNPTQKFVRESESPLVEKIIVGEGEIEIRIEDGKMYACSRNKNGETTYEISKRLESLAPEKALRNAEAGVLATLEMRKRDGETYRGLAKYETKETNLTRQFEQTYGISPKGIDPGILKALILQGDPRREFSIVAPSAKKRSTGKAKMPSENVIVNQEALELVSNAFNSEFYDIEIAS